MAALSLFMALWALVAAQTTFRQVEGLVAFTDLYGSERHATAALECRPGGQPLLYFTSAIDLETILHEFAHAYDCIDDGTMNASPIRGARPAQRPAWVSDYCWTSDAEWYACLVVRERSVRPSLAPEQAPAAAAGTPTPTPTPTPARTPAPPSLPAPAPSPADD